MATWWWWRVRVPRVRMRKEVLYFMLVVKLLYFGAAFGANLNDDDFGGLQALKKQWQGTPPSWNTSDDNPCGLWVGITCRKSRVTAIKLSTIGIKGTLADDIGQFAALEILDLSGNKDLGGSLPPDIGKLTKLKQLILNDCNFTGAIPDAIGSLRNLWFLDFNSNQLSGSIPPSLGNLSKLYWLDLSNNTLTGYLPVSTESEAGLDQLFEAKHFHFNQNQLSGSIPESLFSSKMNLIHVLFDGNQLSGSIPDTLGLVQTIEILRLDRNFLQGPVPSTLNSLHNLRGLYLANNNLSGPLPDLSGLSSLQFVDLSSNKFDPSESSAWFDDLQSLTTLVINSGNLRGEVPPTLFNLPAIQDVILDDNSFGGTLDVSRISAQLQRVSLRDNNITKLVPNIDSNVNIMLSGNPACNQTDTVTILKSQYCNSTQKPILEPYSTDLTRCNLNPCPPDKFNSSQSCTNCPANQYLNPQTCTCANPYRGILVFRAALFHEMPNSSVFLSLEMTLRTQMEHTVPYLYNPSFNNDSYLQVYLMLFPSGQMSFSRSEVSEIGFDLNNQTYALPQELGPYYFLAFPYTNFSNEKKGHGKRTDLIIGLSVACPLLVALVAVSFYAFKWKQRAKRTMELSITLGMSARGPKLKGARWFSYDELRKLTNGFAQNNEIGSGGYGKVYMGMLPSGQLLAIKRAHQGSMQGENAFNTEIELLSRVHHKNLATLVGFCSDQEENMLVYEFIPNGSLRDSLSGKSGVHLDWRRRLRVALGSARGLAYLHEHADPPIIHRDVKSANILLDENLSAKVCDFGLSKLISDPGRGPISSQVKGTLGYLDPEYYMTQQLTEKSDVYSFGVVMLELISGKQPLEKGRYIVRQIKTVLDTTDEHYLGLRGIIDRRILGAVPLAAFVKFVQLALRCVEEQARDRPTMNEVVKEIESMLQSVNDASSSDQNSAASSTSAKGVVIRHPYMDSFGSRDFGSNSLEYSGGYPVSTRVEPK